MGRRTDLTPAAQERICEALRAGHYIGTAAALGGITRVTYYDWRRRGEEEPGSIFADFAEAVRLATVEAEERALAVVEKAANGYEEVASEEGVDVDGKTFSKTKRRQMFDWRAAAWFLERKHPLRWGNRQDVKHSGSIGTVVIRGVEDETP